MASPTRRLALAALLLTLAAAPAHAGPPFISIELPGNPLDRTTRGALLLVHSWHHEAAVRQRVSGTAEGIVNGRRRSVPVTLEATSREGVYALRRTWGDDGVWLLVLRVGDAEWPATALVGVGADGEVSSVRVPVEQRDGFAVPKQLGKDDVEAALRRVAAADRGAPKQLGWLGALAVLPLVGLVARRRASHVEAADRL